LQKYRNPLEAKVESIC